MKVFVGMIAHVSLSLCLIVGVRAQNQPLGGQPSQGVKQSVPDLDEQVAYQRAFEVVLWAMLASAIYRMRVGFLELPGMADNVSAATVEGSSPGQWRLIRRTASSDAFPHIPHEEVV